MVDIQSLRPHPENARVSDEDRIAKSLGVHGQFRTIVVSADGYVLAGNHTYLGAMKRGVEKMAVIRLPLAHDAGQAKEIMVADNAASDGASYDKGLYEALLQDINAQMDGLDGALVESKLLDQLMKDNAADPLEDEVPKDNYTEQFGVIVICEDEVHQERIYNELQGQGFNCKVVTT